MFSNGMTSVPTAPNPHQNLSNPNLVAPQNINQIHEEPTVAKVMAPMQRDPSSYSLHAEQRANAGAPFIAPPNQVSNNNIYANQMHSTPQQVMSPHDPSSFHQQLSHQSLLANQANSSPTLTNSSRQLQSPFHSQSQLQPQISQRPLQPQPDPQPLQSQQNLDPKTPIPSVISSDNALSDNMSAITMMKIPSSRKPKKKKSQLMASEWTMRQHQEAMEPHPNFLEKND